MMLLVFVEKVLSMRPWEIVIMKSLSLLVVPHDPSPIVLVLPRTLTIMYFCVIKLGVLILDAVLETV